jgi:hypothetical protein
VVNYFIIYFVVVIAIVHVKHHLQLLFSKNQNNDSKIRENKPGNIALKK